MNPRGSLAALIGIARAGRAIDRALGAVQAAARPGMTVGELDAIATDALRLAGAVPSMLAYDDGHGGGGFPMALSLCVNEEISGACDPTRVLAPGDLLTADLAARLDGWHADAAVSWCLDPVGRPERAELAIASRSVTRAGFEAVGPGRHWGQVVGAMSAEADRLGVVILRGFDGHGIGRGMHEDPALPQHPADLGRLQAGAERLLPGMVFTIEPVVAWRDTGFVRSGWLDRTTDGSDACFTEATVAVGAGRAVMLASGGFGGGNAC